MKFLNLVFLIVILSSSSFAKNSCNDFFKSKAKNHSSQSKRDSKFEKYLSGSLREGTSALSAEWLAVVESILKMDTKKFREFFSAEYGTNVTKSIKAFSQGFAEVTSSRKSVPKLYHMTSADIAELITRDQKLLLSSGTRNHAAACLGGGNFHAFRNASEDSAILKVKIKSNARSLDLTSFQDYPAHEGSQWNAYKWYEETFVPNLIKGKYKKTLPQLHQLIKDIDLTRKNVAYELSNIEAFSLLMGVDFIKVSETYGQKVINEYWVVNPDAVEKIDYAR